MRNGELRRERRHRLRDDQWDIIKDALPGKQDAPDRTGDDRRQVDREVGSAQKDSAPLTRLESLCASF